MKKLIWLFLVILFAASSFFIWHRIENSSLKTATLVWGNNLISSSQVVQNLASFSPFPVWSNDVDVLMSPEFKGIKIGYVGFTRPTHICGLKNDSSVWCFYIKDRAFNQVPKLPPVVNIDSQAGMQICSRTLDHKIFCWAGHDRDAKLVSMSAPYTNAFLFQTEKFKNIFNSFVDLKMADRSSCGITNTGDVWCWGSDYNFNPNREVPLSNPALANMSADSVVSKVQMIAGAEDVKISRNYSCSLMKDKSVWCWQNEPDPLARRVFPETIKTKSLIISYAKACALSEDGTVYCWKLGAAQADPHQLKFANGQVLQDVTNMYGDGVGFSCGLRSDKTLACWGGPSSTISNNNVCYNNDCDSAYIVKSPNGYCNLTNIKNVIVGSGFSFISIEGNKKYFQQFEMPDRSVEIFSAIIAEDYARAHDLMKESTCLNVSLSYAQDALISAIQKGNVEFVKILIDAGINLNVINRTGKSFLGVAYDSRSVPNYEVVLLLKEAGAVENQSDNSQHTQSYNEMIMNKLHETSTHIDNAPPRPLQ